MHLISGGKLWSDVCLAPPRIWRGLYIDVFLGKIVGSQREDQKQLAPGEKKTFLENAGCAAVYLQAPQNILTWFWAMY